MSVHYDPESRSPIGEVRLESAPDCLRYSDHQIGRGPAFHRAACEYGVEGIVRDMAASHSRFAVRCIYELLLGTLLVYIIGRPAYNFFYANPLGGETLLPSDFYIHAAVFLVLWSGLLVMTFTRRMRRGLMQRIGELARQLAENRLAFGLFPKLEQLIADVRLARDGEQAAVGPEREGRDFAAAPID